MTFKWSREHAEKLVALIKQHHCIYNVRSPDYTNLTMRAQAFSDILRKMKQMDTTITLGDIRKKWKTLRIQFMSERRKIARSKKRGAAGGKIYKSKLWCFDQMSFLTQHTRSGNTIGVGFNDHHSFNAEDSKEFTKTREKNESRRPQSVLEKISAIKRLREEHKAKQSKFSWLGDLVTDQMEEIDPEYQLDAAWTIQCLMQDLIQRAKLLLTTPASPNSIKSSESTKNILQMSMDMSFDKDDLSC